MKDDKLQRPPVPDPDWLTPVEPREETGVDSTGLALLVGGDTMVELVPALAEYGFQVIQVVSGQEAVMAMKTNDFRLVINCLTGEPDKSPLSQFVNEMAMERRRLIYYVLVGADYKTMYNLEALSNSANLVLNSRDAGNMTLALARGFKDHEELFGPYLTACNQP